MSETTLNQLTDAEIQALIYRLKAIQLDRLANNHQYKHWSVQEYRQHINQPSPEKVDSMDIDVVDNLQIKPQLGTTYLHGYPYEVGKQSDRVFYQHTSESSKQINNIPLNNKQPKLENCQQDKALLTDQPDKQDKPKKSNHGTAWKVADYDNLRSLVAKGLSIKEISDEIGRTESAVFSAIKRAKINIIPSLTADNSQSPADIPPDNKETQSPGSNSLVKDLLIAGHSVWEISRKMQITIESAEIEIINCVKQAAVNKQLDEIATELRLYPEVAAMYLLM